MGALPASQLRNNSRVALWDNAQRFGQYTSMPGGYQSAQRAIIPTLKASGFMACRLVGDSSTSFDVRGKGNMSATLTGEGSVTMNGNMASNMVATLTGNGTMTADLRGKGWISATIDAGSRPSAFDIAQEVWQSQKTAYNAAGTMGNALNNASSGGVDMDALAAAVWAYVNRTLTANPGVTEADIVTALESAVIPVNTVQIKGQAINGSGSEADPWGP